MNELKYNKKIPSKYFIISNFIITKKIFDLFDLHASPGNDLFYRSLRTCFGRVAGQAIKLYDFCLMRYFPSHQESFSI